MAFELNGYTTALGLAACVSFLTAVVSWVGRGEAAGGRQFALLMSFVVIWNAVSALEAGTTAAAAKILLSKIGYIGIAGVPPLFLRFALAYSHREVRRDLLGKVLLWSIPALTLGLVMTNEWHHLVWTEILPLAGSAGRVLMYGHGSWYWVWVGYDLMVSIVGVALLVPAAFQYRKLYAWQTAVFLAGIALPWVGDLLYLSRLVFPGLDFATIGFGAMGLLVLIGMQRLALLDMVPVARATVIERMSEGVILLDAHDRVLDSNPAARALLHVEKGGVGAPCQESFPALRGLLSQRDADTREWRSSVVVEGTPPLTIELSVTELRSKSGVPSGRVIVVRDVTVREKLIGELQAALADVKTLRGLLPICSSCKKIRDKDGHWVRIESYVQAHSEAQFTHGLCDQCIEDIYPDGFGRQ